MKESKSVKKIDTKNALKSDGPKTGKESNKFLIMSSFD